jgi:hypothetical protein
MGLTSRAGECGDEFHSFSVSVTVLNESDPAELRNHLPDPGNLGQRPKVMNERRQESLPALSVVAEHTPSTRHITIFLCA